MNKVKQVVESLMSDIKHMGIISGIITIYGGGLILVACILAALALKVIVYLGGTLDNGGNIFIDIMLTYGIATFIIGWIGFRVYQVCSK